MEIVILSWFPILENYSLYVALTISLYKTKWGFCCYGFSWLIGWVSCLFWGFFEE